MAGWWERFTAYFVDSLLILVAWFAVALAFELGTVEVDATLLVWLLSAVYFVYWWSAPGGGRTPGMRLKGISVIGVDGAPISVGRAVIRYVMFLVSFYVLLLGLLWAAWDGKKQGWHDKVAGTFVVKPRVGAATAFVPMAAPGYGGAVASGGTMAPASEAVAAGRIRCAKCGTVNDDARFCGSCGAPLAT